MAGWLHGVFVGEWLSFFHCVASPFHSFVPTRTHAPRVDQGYVARQGLLAALVLDLL